VSDASQMLIRYTSGIRSGNVALCCMTSERAIPKGNVAKVSALCPLPSTLPLLLGQFIAVS